MQHPELLREFNDMVERRCSEESVAADVHNFSKPLCEVDFAACVKVTPSYRQVRPATPDLSPPLSLSLFLSLFHARAHTHLL